jgi:hypothetical protein
MCILARPIDETGGDCSWMPGTVLALTGPRKTLFEEGSMKGRIAAAVLTLSTVASAPAYAQEISPRPGTVEVTVIPGGWTHFSKSTKTSAPGFGSYDVGGAFTYNFNRVVGVEGEIGGSLGVTQNLAGFDGLTMNQKTPGMLSYTGNAVLNAPAHSLVPYATVGVGGRTLYRSQVLGVTRSETFRTGNLGGGVKWYAPNGRWGVRGDYRVESTHSKKTAPAFFGLDRRYAQRVYGGVILNVTR